MLSQDRGQALPFDAEVDGFLRIEVFGASRDADRVEAVAFFLDGLT